MSHTKDLIDEALNKIQDHLQRENEKEMVKYEPFNNKHGSGINKFTEKFGIHVTKTSAWKQSSQFKYDYFAKRSCVGFYNIAFKAPHLLMNSTICLKTKVQKRNMIGLSNTESLMHF